MAKKVSIAQVDPLITEYRGNIAAIARRLGVSRGTIWNRIQESTTLQAKLDDARETMIDNAESTLYTNALAGNMTALIFFLKTQGRRRGYGNQTELTGRDGGPIEVQHSIDMTALSDEELSRIAGGESVADVLSG